MDLVSAKLAHVGAMENTEEISMIKELIQLSINSGKFSVVTALKLSDEQIEYLQYRGYTVEEIVDGLKISF